MKVVIRKKGLCVINIMDTVNFKIKIDKQRIYKLKCIAVIESITRLPSGSRIKVVPTHSEDPKALIFG